MCFWVSKRAPRLFRGLKTGRKTLLDGGAFSWRPRYALKGNDSILRNQKQLLFNSKSNSWLQQGPTFNLLFWETAQKDRLRQSWLWLRLPEGAWINNLMLFCFIFLPIKWHYNISPTHSLSYLFRLQDFWGRKKSPDEIKIKILCSFSASRSKRSTSLGIAVPVCLSRFGAELRHTSRQRGLLFMKIND